MQKENNESLLLNQRELCRYLGISRRIVLKEIIPHLRPVMIGKTIYYYRKDVLPTIEKIEQEQRLEYSKKARQ